MKPKTIANTPLPPFVRIPSYDRAKLQTKIVHLGFGAFHRAHQALFTDDVARLSGSDWGICEVSLFSNRLIKAMRAQDHLYSVIEKGADGHTARVIGVVREALNPSLDGIETVIAKMSEPQVAIVSLTITEKGYCIDPASGTLDKSNPMVTADLNAPTQPQSALGFITAALRRRRDQGLKPFTVLSCDNIQENGHVAKAALVAFAHEMDPNLAIWIEDNVPFPCTMVDRIVPAITDETTAEITNILGTPDPCGIACEPFNQWVIEDTFANGRPNWNIAGAEFVNDVGPYEEMKLRMLNGAHSFLAYLGYLGGHAHISDTMDNPAYRKAAREMMDSQAATLTMPEGTDLGAYADQLIARFANPNLKHKTWQIAMDGSQKIPHRFGGALRVQLDQGSDIKWLALGIAGWMRYVSGIDEQGQEIDVRDPMAAMLRQTPSVTALLSIEAIFAPDIGQNPRVIIAVTEAHQSLVTHGARASVAAL